MSLLMAAVTVAALIVAEHIALWRAPWRLEPPASYIVGMATVGLGMILWGLAVGQVDAAFAFWILTSAAGMADVGAYWVRGRLAALDRRAYRAGQVAGPDDEDDHGASDESAGAGD